MQVVEEWGGNGIGKLFRKRQRIVKAICVVMDNYTKLAASNCPFHQLMDGISVGTSQTKTPWHVFLGIHTTSIDVTPTANVYWVRRASLQSLPHRILSLVICSLDQCLQERM
jgi:hypothetical protein